MMVMVDMEGGDENVRGRDGIGKEEIRDRDGRGEEDVSWSRWKGGGGCS